jgi:hypothetical protein
MSYEKCYHCNHSYKLKQRGQLGFIIQCEITGNKIKIDECPMG